MKGESEEALPFVRPAASQDIVDGVAEGRYGANLQRRFRFNEIVEAHRFMEENRGSGKLVVIVDE